MVAAQTNHDNPQYMTEAEYLAFEEQNEFRHEYARGRVYAMTGASWKHNIINANIQGILQSQLTDEPCISVSNDMRLKVESKSVSFRYPDTMVICDEPEFLDNRDDTVLNPTVVIEVLSPSTAFKDHNEKLDEYTQIDSVQDYILVSQHEPRVQVYTRQQNGKWLYSSLHGLQESIELASINCTLSLARLYAKVDFQDNNVTSA